MYDVKTVNDLVLRFPNTGERYNEGSMKIMNKEEKVSRKVEEKKKRRERKD